MSLTYALEAAVNGTTGPRATLFTGSIAPSGDGVDPDDNQRPGFSPAGAAAAAAKDTFF